MSRYAWWCIAAVLLMGLSRFDANAQDADTDSDGKWRVELFDEIGAVASVNGNVTHGDRFRVAVRGENCRYGLVSLSAYSYYEGSDFLDQQGETIRIRRNGVVRQADIVFTRPFLLGHIAFIELGYDHLARIRADYAATEEISVTILGRNGDRNEYFDIATNSWNAAGLAQALNDARILCLQNVDRLSPDVATMVPGDCPERISIDFLLRFALASQTSVEADLIRLFPCLKAKPKLQPDMDSAAIRMLNSMYELDEPSRSTAAGLIAAVLKVNASSGFPSSQHNYATLFNMDPQSPLNEYFARNDAKFAYWTRKAASNREPRALFNLAVRLADDKRITGFPQDRRLAYFLISELETSIRMYPKRLMMLEPYVAKYKSELAENLGEDELRQIPNAFRDFDFSSLSPD